jgi:hypothetical protein
MNISDPRDRHEYIHYLIAYIVILNKVTFITCYFEICLIKRRQRGARGGAVG